MDGLKGRLVDARLNLATLSASDFLVAPRTVAVPVTATRGALFSLVEEELNSRGNPRTPSSEDSPTLHHPRKVCPRCHGPSGNNLGRWTPV